MKKMTKAQTAAKTAKFRATMAARKAAAAGVHTPAEVRKEEHYGVSAQGIPLGLIPAKPEKKRISKFLVPEKPSKEMRARALDLIETGLLLLREMHK